jgi:hypothetical protein
MSVRFSGSLSVFRECLDDFKGGVAYKEAIGDRSDLNSANRQGCLYAMILVVRNGRRWSINEKQGIIQRRMERNKRLVIFDLQQKPGIDLGYAPERGPICMTIVTASSMARRGDPPGARTHRLDSGATQGFEFRRLKRCLISTLVRARKEWRRSQHDDTKLGKSRRGPTHEVHKTIGEFGFVFAH